MAEVNSIDGTALDSSYFGFTDSQTGIWMPKRYEGTYGTNGFYLDFSDNTSTTTLGIYNSPNGNDFTLNNFAVGDSVKDTPTNNYCNLDPLNTNYEKEYCIFDGNHRVLKMMSEGLTASACFVLTPEVFEGLQSFNNR